MRRCGEQSVKTSILEEMKTQLKEEAAVKRSKVHFIGSRKSCDFMKLGRDGRYQCPRFSLDGRDSLFQCPLSDFSPKTMSLGGGIVAWRKPGVVARLMGLDALPVPFGRDAATFFSRKLNLRTKEEENFIGHNFAGPSTCINLSHSLAGQEAKSGLTRVKCSPSGYGPNGPLSL